jgi:hypothetical protein
MAYLQSEDMYKYNFFKLDVSWDAETFAMHTVLQCILTSNIKSKKENLDSKYNAVLHQSKEKKNKNKKVLTYPVHLI